MKSDHLSVVIVDDHVLVRTGLRMLIDSRLGMSVTGEAGSAAEALMMTARKKPDVVVLDLDLGRDNGLLLIPELKRACEHVRVLVLTGVRDIEVRGKALRAGATGLVLKENASDVLLTAIERVHAGEPWIDRETMVWLLDDLTGESDDDRARVRELTDREREIVALVAHGLRNKEIGDRLFISEITVRHHLTSVFSKLGLRDRSELIIYAYRHRIVELPTKPH